jgi:hypothetical protein
MSNYYLQGEYYRRMMAEYLSYPAEVDDMLSVYTSEEWMNIADMIVTFHRAEPDTLSPKKNLKRMGFGMTK